MLTRPRRMSRTNRLGVASTSSTRESLAGTHPRGAFGYSVVSGHYRWVALKRQGEDSISPIESRRDMKVGDLPYIFISHSRSDEEGKAFLRTVFGLPEATYRPLFYTDDEPAAPHAERIHEQIKGSRALFVLLADSMLDPERHARVWVPFEVGVATAYNLRVVVIDRRDKPVSLPVPGATHYVLRPPRWEAKDKELWKLLVSTGGKLTPGEPLPSEGGLGSRILTFLANAATMDQDETGMFVVVECEGEHCKTKFWVPVSTRQGERHPCPACRQGNAGFMVRLGETVDRINDEKRKRGSGGRS